MLDVNSAEKEPMNREFTANAIYREQETSAGFPVGQRK